MLVRVKPLKRIFSRGMNVDSREVHKCAECRTRRRSTVQHRLIKSTSSHDPIGHTHTHTHTRAHKYLGCNKQHRRSTREDNASTNAFNTVKFSRRYSWKCFSVRAYASGCVGSGYQGWSLRRSRALAVLRSHLGLDPLLPHFMLSLLRKGEENLQYYFIPDPKSLNFYSARNLFFYFIRVRKK